MYLGSATEDVISLAVEKSAGNPQLYGLQCLECLGDMYMAKNKLEEAEKAYMQAADRKDVLGRGVVLRKLGELYMQTNQLKEAEKVLLQAVELHKQAQDVCSEGNDWLSSTGRTLYANRSTKRG